LGDPYRQCDVADACFTDECAYDGGDAACCVSSGLTCAPICQGNDPTSCPPGPDGFDLICLTSGIWQGHCAIDCNPDGTCPAGMACSEGLVDSICTWTEVPAVEGWTCDVGYYGADDGCDCGCGIVDPDCADATVDSCEYCDDDGSCSRMACPGTISPDDNAVCT
jgi:hypothetical protein